MSIVVLSNVRISFPHLKEPQSSTQGGTPTYNAVFIVPPTHPGYADFMKQVGVIAQDKWKEKAADVMNIINADAKKRCYADGSTKVNQKTFKVYDGYEGNIVISANNKNAPQIFDEKGVKVDPNNSMAYRTEAGKIYGGCYVNAVVKPWVQANTHGVGIRCELVAVQFLADGESFGGDATPDVSGVFGATTAAAPAGLPPFMMT